jgi:hypothetical protein
MAEPVGTKNRTIQVVVAVVGVSLGFLLSHLFGTWLGLIAFVGVIAAGYYLTVPTRRDLPPQAPITARNARLANWCGWGTGLSVVGLGVSYLNHLAGGVVIVGGCVVVGVGILITVVSYFR